MNDIKKLVADWVFLTDTEDEVTVPAKDTEVDKKEEVAPTDTPEAPKPADEQKVPEEKKEVAAAPDSEEEEEEEEEEDTLFVGMLDLSSKLDEAIEAGDTNLIYEISAKLKEEAANVSDITSQTKANEKRSMKENKKLLEDKLNLAKALENSKPIVDAIEADAKLKDLIILRWDSEKTEEYKTALMAYTQDLLWVDIKSSYLKKQEEERASLAWGTGILTPNTMWTKVDNLFLD